MFGKIKLHFIGVFLFLFVFVAATAFTGFGNVRAFDANIWLPQCPDISIQTPPSTLVLRKANLFTAKISDTSSSQKLKFVWAASTGKILNPYDGPTMHLIPAKDDANKNVYVFVRVEGLPENCKDTAWEIIGAAQLLEGDPVDGFGQVAANDVKARMDNFYINMSTDPSSTGLIEMFFGCKESVTNRLTRVNRILAAIRFRKYDLNKVSFAFTESDSPQGETKLWTVPSGADVIEDRPTAKFIKGSELNLNPKKALPERQCRCISN